MPKDLILNKWSLGPTQRAADDRPAQLRRAQLWSGSPEGLGSWPFSRPFRVEGAVVGVLGHGDGGGSSEWPRRLQIEGLKKQFAFLASGTAYSM